MNKRFIPLAFLLFVLLSGCGFGADYEVKLAKPLYFNADKDMPLEITVSQSGKAVTGLHVAADLDMANMDHGTNSVSLAESKPGTYEGKVKLRMGGKYEIAFSLEKGGKKVEKVIDYVVKKPAGVALINGKWIKQDELDFINVLNKIQFALIRESAPKKYRGKQLDEALAYVSSQEKMTGNKNQLLTEIIRLRSMALLGTEKGFHVTPTDIDRKDGSLQKLYGGSAGAQVLIHQYGESRFWHNVKVHVPMMLLSDKVASDVLAKTKVENPRAGLQEVRFLAQQKFEDLLVSQVNTLHISIF